MRAAIVSEYGPPECIQIADIPVPDIGPNDVLVQVEAAAVNFPDLLLAAGQYQVKLPLPFVPGSEVAGTISAVGSGVSGFAPGDRVAGAAMLGAFAEYAVLASAAVTRLPERVDAASGAAYGVVYQTAYHALRSVAAIAPGERLCVLGAAGGVGLAAVDVGVLVGAEVVAAATGATKLALCRQRGATTTVDLGEPDLRGQLRAAGGLDVVVDMIGGPAAEQALRAMRPGGRFVTVGYASGEIPRIPLNLVLLKGVSILGYEARTYGDRFPERTEQVRRELADHLAAGRLRPHIGARYPLAATAAAMRLIADRGALGKVIIDVSDT